MTARSSMTLHAGHYTLLSRVSNWNQPQFSPVTYTIEDLEGQEVATKTFTPTINIGGDIDNKFSGGRGQTFEFDILETGDYVFSIYTDAQKNADFVLGMAKLQAKSFYSTGIAQINANRPTSSYAYDLSGRRLLKDYLKPGLYIIDGRKIVVK